GYVGVLARNKPWAALDDGDLAAETAVHLAKLERDVAAAEDHQMRRKEIDLHHSGVGEVPHAVETGDRGQGSPCADVDEDLFGLQHVICGAHRSRTLETSVPLIHRAVLHPAQPGLDAVA